MFVVFDVVVGVWHLMLHVRHSRVRRSHTPDDERAAHDNDRNDPVQDDDRVGPR